MGDKPADPLGSTIDSPDSEPSRSTSARSGQRVSHYLIGESLGEGGMGAVFRAVDEKLGRAVAIKFLHRTDEQSRARFLREARAASALDHPNIGAVHEIGEADGAPFIVMALYEGETLRARIRRGKLEESEIVSIARQLCSALTVAHAAGIVHRDIKPANVMLLPDGTVKLLDFGLAKLTTVDESSLTRDGAILGTLAYMAPEQLQSGAVDARADLWALGAVLYEMLSGQPPFGSGPAANLVTRILTENPAAAKGAPSDLNAVALRLLQKDPSERLSGAASVSELLLQRRAPKRKPRRGWLALVAVVALGSSVIGAAVIWRRPTTHELMQRESQKNHRDHLNRAGAYFNLADYANAADEFEMAYRETSDPSELYNVARAHHLAGHRAKAIDFYRKFLESHPAHPEDVRVWLAELEPGDLATPAPPPAVPSPAPAKRTKPAASDLELAKRLFTSGSEKFDRGDFDGAAKDYEAAYQANHDPSILFNAGQSFRIAKQYGHALLAYSDYLRYAPKAKNRAEVQKYIAEMRDDADAVRKERQQLAEERKKLEADRADLDRRLLALQIKDVKPVEAKPATTTTQAAAPSKPRYTTRAEARDGYLEAVRLFNSGHYTAAATGFEAAYEAVGDAQLLYNIAQSYRMAASRDLALFYYQQYLSTSPNAFNRDEVEQRIAELKRAKP